MFSALASFTLYLEENIHLRPRCFRRKVIISYYFIYWDSFMCSHETYVTINLLDHCFCFFILNPFLNGKNVFNRTYFIERLLMQWIFSSKLVCATVLLKTYICLLISPFATAYSWDHNLIQNSFNVIYARISFFVSLSLVDKIWFLDYS